MVGSFIVDVPQKKNTFFYVQFRINFIRFLAGSMKYLYTLSLSKKPVINYVFQTINVFDTWDMKNYCRFPNGIQPVSSATPRRW